MAKWKSTDFSNEITSPVEVWEKALEEDPHSNIAYYFRIIPMLEELFPQLSQLAREGKMGTFYADFTNPDFIDAVRRLPDFHNSTNIVYISNLEESSLLSRKSRSNLEHLKAYIEANKRTVIVSSSFYGMTLLMHTAETINY